VGLFWFLRKPSIILNFSKFVQLKYINMINKVILVGNLGQDPEVRHLESGSVVAKFSLATNERYKDKSGEVKTITEWHDVVVWRGLAELAERLLTKGKLVYVEGKLNHRKWQDKDGNNRKTTEVLANNFQILEKKDSPSNGGYGGNFPSDKDEIPASKAIPAADVAPVKPNNPAAPTNTASAPSLDDDLPF